MLSDLVTKGEISDSSFLNLIKEMADEIKAEKFQLADIDFNVDDVVNFLSKNPSFQNPNSPVYKVFKELLILRYALHYKVKTSVDYVLGIEVKFPFMSMGNINSRHFLGIDELLIYDFYRRNTRKYQRVCDIGCNVGLHSKMLCELGYEVDSYEPDTLHAEIAKKYLSAYKNNHFFQLAVSSYDGKANFTRIVNNTTGSYINDKKVSYGPIIQYEVDVINASNLSGKYDLFKLDVEGSEVDILTSLDAKDFSKSDFIVEISTPESREQLWKLFSELDVPVYAQKISWDQANTITDLPTSHREGSVFISSRNCWF